MSPISAPGLASLPPQLAAGLRLPGGDEVLAPGIRPLAPGQISESPGAAGPAAPGSFGTLLGEMVREVNARQAVAGQAVSGLMSGEAANLHQVMIAVEEASISFQLMAEVRNRLLESYQEIMRMQI
jgi:flagellar hook-basal body complex protein FliE